MKTFYVATPYSKDDIYNLDELFQDHNFLKRIFRAPENISLLIDDMQDVPVDTTLEDALNTHHGEWIAIQVATFEVDEEMMYNFIAGQLTFTPVKVGYYLWNESKQMMEQVCEEQLVQANKIEELVFAYHNSTALDFLFDSLGKDSSLFVLVHKDFWNKNLDYDQSHIISFVQNFLPEGFEEIQPSIFKYNGSTVEGMSKLISAGLTMFKQKPC